MNIHDFQYDINRMILDRGYDYYNNGSIVEVYKQSEHTYVFHIVGGEDYEVLVKIADNGDVLHSQCDCPYDFGPVCKHEAAAYFKLFDILNQVNTQEDIPTKAGKRETITDVLNNISKEELINIIVNFAHDDPRLEKNLMLAYANGSNEQAIKTCEELINEIIIKYTKREGFIKYRETGAFASELVDVLEKTRNMNVVVAIDVALLLLEEAVHAYSYADDSSGYIGSLVMETIDFIEEIVSDDFEVNERRVEVFEKILAQTDHEVFNGWSEYKIDLLTICLEFADDENLREQLTSKIGSIIDNNSSDDYSRYENERLLQLLYQLIEQYGTQKEAEQFIHGHLQFTSFRENLLNKYFHEGKYEKVIELAKEGEKQNQEQRGLNSKWKKFRYEALKYLSRKEEQQILAKELFLNGDFNYYMELKELTAKNKDEFYLNLKQELKAGEGWHVRSLFLQVIEQENDLDEMIVYVRENPQDIESYAEELVNDFEEEVIEIYKKHIKSTANNSSNRKSYQRVCHKLIDYKKIAGEQNQVDLIHELKDLYRKRPAFIDELGKI